jgi:hypothetical protein
VEGSDRTRCRLRGATAGGGECSDHRCQVEGSDRKWRGAIAFVALEKNELFLNVLNALTKSMC